MLHPKIDFTDLRGRTIPLPEERARVIEAAVVRRVARRNVEARLGGGALGLLAVAAAVLLLLQRRPAPLVASTPGPAVAPQAAVATAPNWGGVVMGDGSRVTFLEEGTELAQSGTAGRSPTLVHGAARFDVVHDESAPFRVTAGSVVIEDVGTVFTVRLADTRTEVSVESGSVSVRGAGKETPLTAGESGVFSPAAAVAEPPVAAPAAAPVTPKAPAPSRAPWTKAAQAGDYDQAYKLMQAQSHVVRDDPEELLLAADSARLSGHVDRAVPLLRRLVARFPSDSRAGLASFTLGRVLLDDLDQPRDAASAFAAAYDRGGPLAEDALSREVEAWSRAGDHAAADSAAERYLATYPNGRRAAFVRRVTGHL
jgi:transmembrane sensor